MQKVADVDSDRMLLRVKRGKGGRYRPHIAMPVGDRLRPGINDRWPAAPHAANLAVPARQTGDLSWSSGRV
jgi:hypothetical protein